MTTPETKQPGPGRLPVAAVIDRAREWVDQHARNMPGFAGAYMWGAITALPPDAPFPLYRDVDVVVVAPAASSKEEDQTLEVFHRGVMFEVILIGLDEHRDHEAVLANPGRAPNIATTTILADPTGMLAPLQQAVAAQYGRRRWVRARCEAEKSSADDSLADMRRASTPVDQWDALWLLFYALSGLLAVALLRRPTTRRTLALLGELLREQGRPDLHEAALELWGSAGMSRSDVELMLQQTAVAFDRAVDVHRTPIPFGFTLRRHLRPYVVEATEELIDAGQHREATFWITANSGVAYMALANDAPEDEKPAFAAQNTAILAALGYGSPAAWASRVEAAEQLAREIYRLADDLVEQHDE